MTEVRNPEAFDLELLHQFFGAATHDASAAMCRWTNGLITLTLDEVRKLPLEDVSTECNVGDELLTMIVLSLQGEIGGEMILVFDDENGRRLAATLLGREPTSEGEWSALEKSALCETGNILSCAYMNALTRLINVELKPSPPFFIQDFGASVLQQALMAQAMTSEEALICRTRFHREGEELNWHVFFVPTQQLQDRLEHALQTKSDV